MKILFPIGTLFPSQAGGPSNSVYWLAKGLKYNNQDVTLVTTDFGINNKIKYDTWIESDYGKVIYFKSWFLILPIKMIFKSLKLINSHDVLHLNSIFYPPSLFCALGAIYFRKPILWSVRGELSKEALKYSSKKKNIILPIIKYLFKSNTIFHATSVEEKSQIENIFGNSVKSVCLKNFLIIPKKEDIPNENCLGYLGRIHPIKNIDKIIMACKYSEQFNNGNFILKIAGSDDNEYAKKLKKLVKEINFEDRVQFIGHIENKNKQIFLASCYATFLVSDSENFGVSVLESLSQGTPVISSKGTPWKELEDENIGNWVNADEISISKAIDVLIMKDQYEYEEMRRKSLIFVKERYDIFHNIGNWISTYNRLIQNK